jgi:phage gp36-like protein
MPQIVEAYGQRISFPDGMPPAEIEAAIRKSAMTLSPKESLKGEMYQRMENYSGRDAIGGALRGSGSIGATAIRPFESAEENEQRRAAIDAGLTNLIGSDPNSMAYKTNKLGAEIAGTMGIGGTAANLLRMIPGAAKALPTLIPAIESAGMSAPGATGLYQGANRVAGGAVTGALTAGAINPADARMGAMIGGATPAAVQMAGTVGSGIRSAFSGAPINPVLRDTARESIEAGYVIPPNMVNPSFKNQVVESIAGKQATQQVASIKNTQNNERLVRQALALPDDVPLTKGALEDLRKKYGKTYQEVASLNQQAAADLEALKQARSDATTWFNSYNRTADPSALSKAKEYREMADNLENWLEFHAAQAGKQDLIPALQKARKEIAKTYTVGRALNDAAGTVDARVLGRLYEKGSPLSDGLEKVGKFASAFPTVAKSPQQIGSPAAHNLKSIASMAMGGGAYMGMGPAGLAAAAVPFVMPPLARARMFSDSVQRSLTEQPALAGLFGNPEALLLTQGAYRSAPLLASQ